jgi:hypothetical protein
MKTEIDEIVKGKPLQNSQRSLNPLSQSITLDRLRGTASQLGLFAEKQLFPSDQFPRDDFSTPLKRTELLEESKEPLSAPVQPRTN